MIFGFPWMQTFKPEIDWEGMTVKGGPIKIKTTQLEPTTAAKIA